MDNSKVDPIRDGYFVPLNRAEVASDVLFSLGALVSLIVFFVAKAAHPVWYGILQGALIALVVAIWLLGIGVRSYFAPRAHDRRFEDFLSNAYGVPLSGHEATTGYYHTDAKGVEAVGAQLLENAFHSKDTALIMARNERWKAGVYLLLLFIAVVNRTTDLNFVAIIAQAIFSEQVLSRYIRVEWMRRRFEAIYRELYNLFQAKPDSARLEVLTWSLVNQYESTKASSGITLSNRIFERRNSSLSAEWLKIKEILRL